MEFDPQDDDKELEILQNVQAELPDMKLPTAPPPEAPVMPPSSFSKDPEIEAAKNERDREIGKTNLLQGITGIGTALASQGRVEPDSGVFDSARKSAEKGVDEALKEKESNRKTVSDYIRAKAAAGGAQHKQAVTDALGDYRKKTLGQRRVNFINRIDQEITNDKTVAPSEQNLASLDKAHGLLTNKNIPITPQILADAQQDNASAMQIRGGGATEGKIDRTSIDTAGLEIAKLVQKYGNQPGIDLRSMDPKLVETVLKQTEALRDGYGPDIKKRKMQLLQNKRRVLGADPEYAKYLDEYEAKLTEPELPNQLSPTPIKAKEAPLTTVEKKRLEELRAKRGK